ncbi:MAG: hypothetical protein KDK90_17155, partial [Leptospiraceae bacterium]|nr:hypothetical protein [Leptospiraceae bacterium]
EDSEDEDITLSGDELDNILESGDFETEEVKSVFDEDSEDEDITLSGDELDNILESGDFETEEVKSVFDEDSEDEDITLSGDELDNILESGDFEEEISEADSEEIQEDVDNDLSSEELASIIGDVPPEETLIAKNELVDEEIGNFEDEDEIQFGSDDGVVIDLDEYLSQDENRKEPQVQEKEKTEETKKTIAEKEPSSEINNSKLPSVEGTNQEELKKMMSYIDELLGKLPDDIIREFVQSEYFELYKKIMSDLGL